MEQRAEGFEKLHGAKSMQVSEGQNSGRDLYETELPPHLSQQ